MWRCREKIPWNVSETSCGGSSPHQLASDRVPGYARRDLRPPYRTGELPFAEPHISTRGEPRQAERHTSAEVPPAALDLIRRTDGPYRPAHETLDSSL